jgi:DnaB-like helicase N terminal domain
MNKTEAERSKSYRERKKAGQKESQLVAIEGLQHESVQPHSESVEQNILGCIMIDDEAIHKVIQIFGQKNPFYILKHQMVYDAILYLYNKVSHHINRNIVWLQLEEYEEFMELGCTPYLLVEMTESISSTAHLEELCQKVLELSICRDFINFGAKLMRLGYEKDMTQGINEITNYHIGFSQAKKIQFEAKDTPQFCELFPRFRSTIVFAPAKTGKSAVVFSLFDTLTKNYKIVDGYPIEIVPHFWFPNKVGRAAKVLLFDGEMENNDYEERRILESNILRVTAGTLDNIKAEVLIHKPDFIIIDTISHYVPNLLDMKAIRKFLDMVRVVKKYCGVIIIAHTPKSEFGKKLSTASLFGSVTQVNQIENLISINKINGKIYMKQHLSRCKPAFEGENEVLMLNKIDTFAFEPTKIEDERKFFYDIKEYKKVTELWNRGNFDCKHSFCRNYGIKTIGELNEILEIAKIPIEENDESFDFEFN